MSHRVAVAQVSPVFMDKAGSMAKALDVIQEAAANGAKLVAFPETWIPCFPLWMYDAAGWNDPTVKEAFRQLQNNSVEVPGPEVTALCEAARQHEISIVMGVNERDSYSSGGTIYNSQIVISSQGELLGVHRKLMPTHAEKLLWGVGDGSDLKVYDTEIGRLGSLICWEHWMPLGRFAMHAKREQIHVAGWPDLPEVHQIASRHYAFEGRAFVLAAGSYLSLEGVPKSSMFRKPLEKYLETVRESGWGSGGADNDLLAGGSGIVAPDGNWITEPVSGREEIIYGDVDLDIIGREQLAFDATGHYSRPDVFQLTVDTREKRSIEWLNRGDPQQENLRTAREESSRENEVL